MSFVDGNAWYWISETRVNWTSALFYNGNGDMYFSVNNSASSGQYWQIYSLPNNRFQFRNKNSNTLKQLAVCYKSTEISSSHTQPCMANSTNGEDQQWTISDWGDGTYRLQNVANGTDLNMDWHPGGPGFMSPVTAVTPIQPAQHWIFSSIGSVQDGLYSTSIIQAAATNTAGSSATGTTIPASASASATATGTNTAAGSSSSNTSAAQPSPSSSSNGLSSGAAAGIGIGVAVAVIALAVFAFLFIRRRKKAPKGDSMQELPGTSAGNGTYGAGTALPGHKYEKTGPVYEAPANQPTYEMQANPSEMPGSQVYRK